MPGKCIQNLEKRYMMDYMGIKLFLFSTAVKGYTYFFLGPTFLSHISLYDRIEPQQWPPESLRPQYQGWGSWRSGCRRRKVCWSRYKWGGHFDKNEAWKDVEKDLAKGKHWNWVVSSLSSASSPAIPPSRAFAVNGAKWGLALRPRQTGAHQAFRLIACL